MSNRVIFVTLSNRVFPIIVTSSTEAELNSVAYCVAEVAFIRRLDQELGSVQVSPTIIFQRK
jgi:hypothetical protein